MEIKASFDSTFYQTNRFRYSSRSSLCRSVRLGCLLSSTLEGLLIISFLVLPILISGSAENNGKHLFRVRKRHAAQTIKNGSQQLKVNLMRRGRFSGYAINRNNSLFWNWNMITRWAPPSIPSLSRSQLVKSGKKPIYRWQTVRQVPQQLVRLWRSLSNAGNKI